MRPRYYALEKNISSLHVEEVDFDDCPDLVKTYQIGTTLPVAVFLDDEEKEIGRLVGEISTKKLNKFVESLGK